MNITETIRTKLLDDGKGGHQDSISNDDSLWSRGVLDSVGMIDLILFMEKTFDIKVREDDLSPENFDSINRISRYVSSRLGK
jgi:acyl carrier protein